ncbi:hypothetical protein ACVXZZ_00460 [Staphylococcus aureus]
MLKAWDNRYGCVLAIEALELLKDIELDVDLYVGANVQRRGWITRCESICRDDRPRRWICS